MFTSKLDRRRFNIFSSFLILPICESVLFASGLDFVYLFIGTAASFKLVIIDSALVGSSSKFFLVLSIVDAISVKSFGKFSTFAISVFKNFLFCSFQVSFHMNKTCFPQFAFYLTCFCFFCPSSGSTFELCIFGFH